MIYRDRGGQPLYRVVRRDAEGKPKRIHQERYDEATGRFIGGKGCMQDVHLVPYHLNEWNDRDGPVLIAEGERKGLLGPADGSVAMIDALHHAAHAARTRNVQAAYDLLEQAGVVGEPAFLASLEAVLEVLPPSSSYTGFEPADAAKPAASDFEALENLRRLAFTDQVDEPKQLGLFQDEIEAAAAD